MTSNLSKDSRLRAILNDDLLKNEAKRYQLDFDEIYNIAAVYGFMDELYFIVKNSYGFELVPSDFFKLVSNGIPSGWVYNFDFQYKRFRHILSFYEFANKIDNISKFIDKNIETINILEREYNTVFKKLMNDDIVTINYGNLDQTVKLYQIKSYIGGYDDLYSIIDMDTNIESTIQRSYLKPFYAFD